MKGAKKEIQQKYYAENKEKISERRKVLYENDLEKSCADSAARSKASYDKDPESGMKSTVRSKACYDKDLKKSRADCVARSKASYEKNIEKNRSLKRQRYVIFCVFTY